MSQFQPLLDYVTHPGNNWTVTTDEPDWVEVEFNRDVRFNVNGPGHWSDDDLTWGVTIFTDGGHGFPPYEQHFTGDTLDSVIKFLDKRLNPSERDLNNAWGV